MTTERARLSMLTLIKSVSIALFVSLSLAAQPLMAVEEGVAAPDFTLPGVRENEAAVTLSALRGQIVYVDFWASWCVPCLRSLPEIHTLYEKYRDQGFEVIAITIDDPVEDALDFLDDLDVPLAYRVALDQIAEVMDQYGVVGMPTSFLIDREGIVQKVHKGFRQGDTELLEQALLGLLAQ